MMKRILAELSMLALILILPLIGGTNAFLFDRESSSGNSFSAATLDFSLRDTGNNPLTSPLFNIDPMAPGDSQTKIVRVKKDGSSDFQYQISGLKTSGDTSLCEELQIEAKLGGVTKYTGSLTGLNLTPAVVNNGQDDWTFILSFNDSSAQFQDKTCNFNLKFSGWQTGSDGSWGLSDEETIGNSVNTLYPRVSLNLSGDQHTISFIVSNISKFKHINYQLSYDTDTSPQGAIGNTILSGDPTFQRDITLGTCSDVCLYQTGVHNFQLTIQLTDIDSHITNLSGSL